MAVDNTISFKPRFLTDESGKRTGVLLSIEEYEALMELVEDHNDAIAGDRAVEESEGYVSLDELTDELKRDGKL